MKIPILKGRWEKTLGRWAGKAATAIQVVTAGFEIYNAHKRQEAQNRENRQRTLALYQASDNICSEVSNDLTTLLRGAISPIFDERRDSIQNEINDRQLESDDMSRDFDTLNQAREKMMALHF